MGKINVYEVEDNVPVPIDILSTLRSLEIGQSFTFPMDRRKTVQTYASRVKKETGRSFSVRTEVSDRTIGRVWRTE